MGIKTLSKICRLFLDSYWTRASGFPDLCMWNKKDNSLVIVEVKVIILVKLVLNSRDKAIN